jgi:hypothetical protein
MDNVQNFNSYVNIPSSQTYRSKFSHHLIYCLDFLYTFAEYNNVAAM